MMGGSSRAAPLIALAVCALAPALHRRAPRTRSSSSTTSCQGAPGAHRQAQAGTCHEGRSHHRRHARTLIVQSKAAPYLPDLFFRLAELYVEKSRYMYVLQSEESQGSEKGSIIAPEVRLLKEKALQIYERILTEFPDYRDADKVIFFVAHEHRELGQFPEMLKTYQSLVDKHPKSPLVPESLYIMGDYWFDKQDFPKAETYYQPSNT